MVAVFWGCCGDAQHSWHPIMRLNDACGRCGQHVRHRQSRFLRLCKDTRIGVGSIRARFVMLSSDASTKRIWSLQGKSWVRAATHARRVDPTNLVMALRAQIAHDLAVRQLPLATVAKRRTRYGDACR